MSTSREINKEIRIRRAVELLSICQHKHEIFRVMEAEFGIKWRQAEEYLRLARQRILEDLKRDKQEHVADSFNLYKSIVNDPNVRPVDRLRAQEQLDRLLGLAQPQKIAPVTPDGEQSWSPESLDELRQKLMNRLVVLSQPSRS